MSPKRERPILYIGLDDRPPSYFARLMRFAERRSRRRRNCHVMMSHHVWCPFFKGRACNCDPNIREMSDREILGI